MVTKGQLEIARLAAEDLRRRGEVERAQTIEALLTAAGEIDSEVEQPRGEERTVDLFGVDGRIILHWAEEGRAVDYRIGTIPIPREIVEKYLKRARSSLQLEPVSDGEAVRFVA